jgi:uncharacterized protein YjbJ (UPF0337 family)
MDKDKIKGTVDDAVGRAKRQVGEWTDDPNKQMEGTAQQIKGKAEKISGNVKDAIRNATDSSRPSHTDDNSDTIENDDRKAGHRH